MSQNYLAGAVEDKAAEVIANTLAKTIEKTLYGGPAGSKGTAERADFYALVLSKTGEKFIASPQGEKLVNKISWTVALPAVLVGLGIGYFVFKKKA